MADWKGLLTLRKSELVGIPVSGQTKKCKDVQPRCDGSNFSSDYIGFTYPWGEDVIQFKLYLRNLFTYLKNEVIEPSCRLPITA